MLSMNISSSERGVPRGVVVRRRLLGVAIGLSVIIWFLVAPALGLGAVAWSVRGAAQPSQFLPVSGNRYALIASNTGSEPSTGEVTLTDHLPAGLTLVGKESGASEEGAGWTCSEVAPSLVVCSFPESLPMGGYTPALALEVSGPVESSVPLINNVVVTGGGAAVAASTAQSTLVGVAAQKFGITDFTVEARNVTGEAEQHAGGHPWQVTASLDFPWELVPPNNTNAKYRPVENVKKISVELPAGMVGFPLSTEHCTQVQLFRRGCPQGSRVGTLAIAAGKFENAEYLSTTTGNASAIYNMFSEPGYPAVLGFTYANQTVYLYATVVHSKAGDRVRLTTVGVPPVLETGDAMLTLWGEPGAFDETGSVKAFIEDPVDCSVTRDTARVEVESWENPGQALTRETVVFQEMTGCGALRAAFTPSLSFSPLSGVEGTTKSDAPSGFQGSVSVPQASGFEEVVVPEVRDVSATVPLGVSLNPAAAQGLVGCAERGPEGFNLGTSSVGPGGRDEGNPEATEFGAGHAGGNGSLYDDNQYHTAPGHCPKASQVGLVEVLTPLLENRCGKEPLPACGPAGSPAPLQGHVYLAQPKCGGSEQGACTPQDAEDGTLLAGYVELAGNGVLIKERATLQIDQSTGLVTMHLKDAPQFPFSELRLRVHGGERASLATPQTCGAATTTSSFTPWSSSEPFAPAPASFTVDADGTGGACPATWPFAPGFSAGSVSTAAAGFTAFTTTLTRKDREQNPTGLSVTTPLELFAMLSSVTPCPEPQAAAGTCPASSLVGHDTAGAGSGTEPFYVHGSVYLTGPYKGAPFGLDVVTPAAAGPFNLGNIVTRAAINIDPNTAQVSIVSDPIPQSQLGVPLRLKVLSVTIDRENFVINPTTCAQQQVTGTTTGNQGSVASLSAPFAVTGCASLKSNPIFMASVPGKASKRNGAKLTVKVTSTPEQAGLKSVKLDLPRQLPSRQATYALACTFAQFSTNLAGCPSGAVIGTSVLRTPILKSPMTGPIYLVSHGGAAFPDVVFVLQAEGITIELTGNTAVKHGITSQTFRAIPGAPFTEFTATLPAGPHSILGVNLPKKAKFNFCGQKLTMPIHTVAQNNAQTTKTTKIAITGCKSGPKPHKKHAKH